MADDLHARIAAALTAEHYRRAQERIAASPEEHCAAMADAVLSVRDEELERLRVRLENMTKIRNAHAAMKGVHQLRATRWKGRALRYRLAWQSARTRARRLRDLEMWGDKEHARRASLLEQAREDATAQRQRADRERDRADDAVLARERWRKRAEQAEVERDALKAATAALLTAQGRMLDDWAEAGEERRQELWQRLHETADRVRDALDGHELNEINDLKATIERVRADAEAQCQPGRSRDVQDLGVYSQARRTLRILAALDAPETSGDVDRIADERPTGVHPFQQNLAATQVSVCICGKWRDHHLHGDGPCGCDACREGDADA